MDAIQPPTPERRETPEAMPILTGPATEPATPRTALPLSGLARVRLLPAPIERFIARLRAGLVGKLFVSYLLVVLVGALTLFVSASFVAPAFFSQQMQQMMQGRDMGGMMGGGSTPTLTAASLDDAFRLALMRGLLIATTLATLAAALISLFVSRQIARPIQRLAQAARRIGLGQYAQRVTIPAANQRDEIGQLAASFNAMAAALEQTERHRLELVGDVAHELRTPIATLEGYLEGLLDGVVEPTPQTLARLHNEAGHLRRLVGDLQELSRAEARQIPLRLEPLAPGALVEVARERLGPQFEEKGLTLEMTLAPRLPAVTADRDRAAQVLTNLLTNALRYTPAPGHVWVRVERVGATVAFRVSDTGVGLAPEHLARLFERFYRVDKSRSRALGGSGIGLTIAKALAEAMGGQLTAESAGLGRGSAFTFSLPVAGG